MSIPLTTLEFLYNNQIIPYIPYDIYSGAGVGVNAGGYGNGLEMGLPNQGVNGNSFSSGLPNQGVNGNGFSSGFPSQGISQVGLIAQPQGYYNYPQNQFNNSNLNQLNSLQAGNMYTSAKQAGEYSPLGMETGSVVDEIRSIKSNSNGSNTVSNSLTSDIVSEKDKKGTGRAQSNPNILPKALLSISAILITLIALFRGKKK